MSDGNEDVDAWSLVEDAIPRLRKLKDNHELLRYYTPQGIDHFKELSERFGVPGTPPERRRGYHWIAYTLSKYYLAIEEACRDPEKPIVVRHVGSAAVQTGVLTDVLGDDDLPF